MQRQEEESAMQGVSVPPIMACPSFRETFGDDLQHESPDDGDDSDGGVVDDDDGGVVDDDDDDDFEFTFVVKDPASGSDITADDIFSNGQIRPIYPVFNRALLLDDDDGADPDSTPADGEESAPAAVRGTLGRLLFKERGENPGSASSSSNFSSGMDELEGIPPGTYCVWAPGSSASPSPSRCKKSSSTGSSLRWRLRELVVGRSHSDGKEKFVFLAAEEKRKKSPRRESRGDGSASPEKSKTRGKGRDSTDVDAATTRRVYYGNGSPARSGAARRSFLPYKQDLVGFFASVNGLTRTHHPF